MQGNLGTHITHCCLLHGCKYGDEDCPVETRQEKQSGPCYDCCGVYEEDNDRSIDHFRGFHYRREEGRYIHDGDCYFWGHHLCTCGLIHKLLPHFGTEIPECVYPDFYEHRSKHDRILWEMQNWWRENRKRIEDEWEERSKIPDEVIQAEIQKLFDEMGLK